MGGAIKRIEREIELSLQTAHAMASFNAATKSKGGLKPLAHYTRKMRGDTPEDMLALLKSMGAKSDMKIRRIPLANDR